MKEDNNHNTPLNKKLDYKNLIKMHKS